LGPDIESDSLGTASFPRKQGSSWGRAYARPTQSESTDSRLAPGIDTGFLITEPFIRGTRGGRKPTPSMRPPRTMRPGPESIRPPARGR